jgi:hypothetical protein
LIGFLLEHDTAVDPEADAPENTGTMYQHQKIMWRSKCAWIANAQLLKSFITTAIFCNLSAILFATAVAAQTRLGPSQVAPLTGDVKGSFASTVLRDYNSAVDHGNGVTNAIYSAIADCGSVICTVNIPASYGTGETVPGYQLNYTAPTAAATTAGTIGIFDRRYGEARMFVNNDGFNSGLTNSPTAWVYDYYSKAAANAELASLYVRQWSLDGGHNQANSALNYSDKTTWAAILSNEISHTQGQHLNAALGTQSTSIGNTMGLSNIVTCYGGYSAQGDLGCHAMDNSILEGPAEYSGTLTGSPTTGSTSLSVSVTQGQNTQGAGRFLVKTNAGTINTGTITSVYNNGGPTAVIGAGTAWPVSTMIGQLGTNIYSPGVTTVTPASFTVGALASLTTSSLVCVSDQESFEMLYPTAITSTTFTANFAKIHPSYAVISSGGLCGYMMNLTADNVTNSTYTTKTQTITGTLHYAWPVMYSTSATSAAMLVTADGGFQQIVSRWNSNTNNGYVLYPFAEVTSVQQAGGLSNTLTVGPNNVTWTAGDSVSEFLYPAGHHTFGNLVIESYYPNTSPSGVFGVTYNSLLTGNDTMLSMANNAPLAIYNSGGGNFGGPTAIRLSGPTAKTITVDVTPDNAALAVGCLSPCNSTFAMIAAGNAAYYDFVTYDQGNKLWSFSATNNSTHYYWGANGFGTPFNNTYFSADSSANGYLATQEARTTTSANSDYAGELTFSSSSSATQSLQGAYGSHPECVAKPQFDPGSGNRFWISYGATSFTVTFASAVSGLVSYSCVGRN